MDAKQLVVGYRFGWQHALHAADDADDDNQRLIALVARELTQIKSGRYFFDICAASLLSADLETMTPANVVLIVSPELLLCQSHIERLKNLRKLGFCVALRGADLAFVSQGLSVLVGIDYLFIAIDDPQFKEISAWFRFNYPAAHVVVEQVPDWAKFDAYASSSQLILFENLCSAPRHNPSSSELSSDSQKIFRLMQMLREDADIRELEKVFQSDATLSFKLLRYINSAGFGLKVEIESLRQAVAMLGYRPLFRWLTLMLARSNSGSFSPALLQVSIVRGRFAELLARVFFSFAEAENLFVVGMFSRLDHLLGLPIEQVLKEIVLPAAVNQALVARTGPYGPFLAVAEASEQENGASAILAAALLLTPEQVNKAHLSALAWAKNLDF